jgi:hypothetical protein
MFPFLHESLKKKRDDSAAAENDNIEDENIFAFSKTPRPKKKKALTDSSDLDKGLADDLTKRFKEIRDACFLDLVALRNELITNKTFKIKNPKSVYTDVILSDMVIYVNRG